MAREDPTTKYNLFTSVWIFSRHIRRSSSAQGQLAVSKMALDVKNVPHMIEESVPLLSLVEGQVDQSIIVRMLRSWEVRNFKQKGTLMSVDMLLLDEKDTMIQASIYHRRFDKFKGLYKEGKVYCLSQFDVVPSFPKYKITDNKFSIRFTDSTEIVEVPFDEMPIIKEEKFRLHKYSEIEALADTNLQLIDIVGQLLHVQGTNLEDSTSTQRIVLLLLLQEKTTIQVTLWDNQAAAFRKVFCENQRKSSVVITTCLNPKKFAGKLQLSSTGSTKFYINYNLQAVKEFMERMGIEHNILDLTVAETKSISKSYEFWAISKILHFISEGNEEEKEVICQAKIIDISTRNGWNYLSCTKCSKKLEKTGRTLLCNVCHDVKTIGTVRFRVELVVECKSSRTTFVMFDKDVRNITNTTADEVAASQVDESTPDCLLQLIGKTMDFQVKITQFNFKTSFQTFTVSRIVDEEPGYLPMLESPKIESGTSKEKGEASTQKHDLIFQIKKEEDDGTEEEGDEHERKRQRTQ